MLLNRTKSSLTTGSLIVIAVGAVALPSLPADAADYEMVASGPLLSAFSESSTFDGTNHGTLPPVLDILDLEGGSFNATFRFSTVTPLPGATAFYELAPSAGMTFDLFNSAGGLVHHGGNSSEPIAIVSNNYGAAPYTVDQVLLGATVNSITGWQVPPAIYSAPGDLIAAGDLSFAATLNGDDYLTDLSIPTDAAQYLAFPYRVFSLFIEFGDGDYIDRVGPYQLIDTIVEFQVTALTVAPVPEPGMVSLFIPAALASARRRRGSR